MLTKLKFLTSGESHGKGLLGILDGIPAGLELSKEYIDKVNKRRKELGFGNYVIGENNNETYQFVVNKINSGKEFLAKCALL